MVVACRGVVEVCVYAWQNGWLCEYLDAFKMVSMLAHLLLRLSFLASSIVMGSQRVVPCFPFCLNLDVHLVMTGQSLSPWLMTCAADPSRADGKRDGRRTEREARRLGGWYGGGKGGSRGPKRVRVLMLVGKRPWYAEYACARC